jgi:pimeloyl-ACP methyl ester carboxylesterase
MRCRYRRTGALALGLILTAAGLSGCGSLGRSYEAVLVLGDLAAGDGDSRLKRRAGDPQREDRAFSIEDRHYDADLYLPEQARRGTLVLVHGFTEDGRRDPRLVDFANTLARAGFRVLVPELDGLRDLSISTREAEAIADAVRYATGPDGPAEGGSTALAAISFAVGPALVAAMEDDTRDQVSFVISVGGYYDLPDMLRYVTTGHDRGGAGSGAPPPQRGARWATLLSQSHWLDDPQEGAALKTIARRRMEDGGAYVVDQLRELGPQGRTLYSLVMNRDPDHVEQLLGKLPPRLLEELQALDLARLDLDRLKAKVVMIHGPDDRVIPVSHSHRLRDALPEGQARLFEAGGLGHVDLSPGLRDGLGLWRATRYVLRLGEEQHTLGRSEQAR